MALPQAEPERHADRDRNDLGRPTVTSFVYFFTHSAQPFEAAATRLVGDPVEWLPGPAERGPDGYTVELRSDGALPARLDAAPVRVRVGAVTVDDEQLRLPVWWTAAVRMDRLFPQLTGELELRRLAGSGCRLSIVGTYQPPGGPLGEIADRLAGQRVAEACARRFVLDIEARLAGAFSSAPRSASPGQ